MTNHPVHIITTKSNMSTSAFIPFCEFGGNMSDVGVKIDQFDTPVCNSFQAKILNDQLCYEIDLQKYSNNNNIERELKSGFAFIMDYSEDRQVNFNEENQIFEEDFGLVDSILEAHEAQSATIYLNTIGNYKSFLDINATKSFFQSQLY